jgi:hypothetical protein
MVQRRDLVGGGLVAGFASLMATSAEAVPAAVDGDDETAIAVNRLRETYEGTLKQVYDARWKGVTRVRQQQRTWLLATRKYPDFLEIGLDVWDNVYDWHVAYQQALNVQRLADGRYGMAFMFTTLLLRSDLNPDFVGYPFDADAQGRTR